MDAQAALEALPSVVDVMSRELQWDEVRQEKEWTDTVRFLGTMGLPASMLAITKEHIMEGKLGHGFVPRKGRGKVEKEVEQVDVTEVHLPTLDSEVV